MKCLEEPKGEISIFKLGNSNGMSEKVIWVGRASMEIYFFIPSEILSRTKVYKLEEMNQISVHCKNKLSYKVSINIRSVMFTVFVQAKMTR